MISIQAKKHDNYSVEFKFGFNSKDDGIVDDFSVNAWMFVPNSLDINPENYGKKQFYRDIKSNIRLITPVYLMRDIARDSSLPLELLSQALEKVAGNHQQVDLDSYQYHLKMFAAIFKSALRDQVAHIASARSLESADYLVKDFVESTRQVLDKFRGLYHIIDVPTVTDNTRSYFRLCDEFMSHVVEMRTIRLIKTMDSTGSRDDLRSMLMDLIRGEREYKVSRDYGVLNGDSRHDRQRDHCQ